MERPSRLLLTLLAASTLAAGLAPDASAQDRRKATPIMAPAPPPAMPQSVRVIRGRKVEIPLRIFGRANETLRYVIKTPPAHGKLSEPRVVEREVSAITYEPPGDFKVTADRFTYSVQNSVGVSAPVEVSISIIDEAPILTMPAVLDYGTLLAGASASKQFELANRGGGLAEGELLVPAPWRVEGRNRYQLATGEAAVFKITFAPGEGGNFRGEIRYTSNPEHTTALAGVAEAPISIDPPEVQLRQEPNFPARTGAFEIVNRTDEARAFKLSAGPRLRLDSQATVPARGRLAIAVTTDAADVTALNAAVRVETEGFVLNVPVKAPPVGPILRVAPGRLNFGRLPAEQGGQVALVVENIGGVPAGVTSEAAEPFALTPPSFLLSPGEKRQVAALLQPSAAGPYRGWLKLKAAPSAVELEMEGELATGALPAAPGAMASRRSSSSRAESARVEASADPIPWTPDLNIVGEIRVREVQPTSALLEWPTELSTATRFRVERMMLARNAAGELGNVWLELPQVVLNREEPQWKARVSGLAPANSQTLRVLPVDDAGSIGDALFRIDFRTLPEPQRIRPPGKFQLLFGALAVCIAAMIWKRRRQHRGSGF